MQRLDCVCPDTSATGLLIQALPLPDDVRFTLTYLIGGIPIAVVAIGSTAPGILFLPFQAMRSDDKKDEARERRARHEAAHLLCSYCLGVPAASVSVGESPEVVIYDEVAVTQPGALVPEESLPPLAVVAMAGLMAEAEKYGDALGASADLAGLNELLLRATPAIPPQEQQDLTRYAAFQAWVIVKKYEKALDAMTQALLDGKGLVECLRAGEAAEAAPA